MIQTSVPSDQLRPQSYIEFDYTSKSRGLSANERMSIMVGYKRSTGAAPADTPVPILTEAEADDQFGVGSEAALMCRKAFETWRLIESLGLGSGGQLFAVGLTEPVGGAIATGTITVTGTATESRDLVLIIAGVRVRVSVTSGDVQNTIAASIKAAIDQVAAFVPVGAAVATNITTLTYRHKGAGGNDVNMRLDLTAKLPAGVTVAFSGSGQLTGGTGLSTMTPALDATLTKPYQSVAIAEHDAASIAVVNTHLISAWAPARKRFRRAFFGDRGSIAAITALAAAPNSERITILGCRNLFAPGFLLAAYGAAVRVSNEKPNMNWDDLPAPFIPPLDSDAYTDGTEFQAALYGGFCPMYPSADGQLRLCRLVTTKTTEGGVRFNALIDAGTVDALATVSLEIDAQTSQARRHRNLDDDLLAELKTIAYAQLKVREADGWIMNVDSMIGSLVVERHPTVRSRSVMQVPMLDVPAAHQNVIKVVLWNDGI